MKPQDGILAVKILDEEIEEEREAPALPERIVYQPKGAVLTIRFQGELRTIKTSQARGLQALGEVLPEMKAA